jgi:putative transcriptional regulator
MDDKKNFSRIMAGLAEVAEIVEGRASPAQVFVPTEIDVREVRKGTGLSQSAFAARYGFSVGSVRDWEQRRRRPEASARVLLKVIQRRPDAVDEALRTA